MAVPAAQPGPLPDDRVRARQYRRMTRRKSARPTSYADTDLSQTQPEEDILASTDEPLETIQDEDSDAEQQVYAEEPEDDDDRQQQVDDREMKRRLEESEKSDQEAKDEAQAKQPDESAAESGEPAPEPEGAPETSSVPQPEGMTNPGAVLRQEVIASQRAAEGASAVGEGLAATAGAAEGAAASAAAVGTGAAVAAEGAAAGATGLVAILPWVLVAVAIIGAVYIIFQVVVSMYFCSSENKSIPENLASWVQGIALDIKCPGTATSGETAPKTGAQQAQDAAGDPSGTRYMGPEY